MKDNDDYEYSYYSEYEDGDQYDQARNAGVPAHVHQDHALHHHHQPHDQPVVIAGASPDNKENVMPA